MKDVKVGLMIFFSIVVSAALFSNKVEGEHFVSVVNLVLGVTE